jgi:predicted regulator of Ras-like GTPase activity (Roadblock/LC7/MglB family)
MDALRAESTRDQAENEFTAILRRMFQNIPALEAAVFVDTEGECIDYVTCLDPFEAKVSAAHLHMLLGLLRAARASSTTGDTIGFELVASKREAWVQRIGDDYVLVVILGRGFDRGEVRDAMALAGREFRAEVGIAAPGWEQRERLSVRVRASPGWTYAPEGFSVGGERIAIVAVLGRWTERSGPSGSALVCFRVRTSSGQELTLAHDEVTEAWVVRD